MRIPSFNFLHVSPFYLYAFGMHSKLLYAFVYMFFLIIVKFSHVALKSGEFRKRFVFEHLESGNGWGASFEEGF